MKRKKKAIIEREKNKINISSLVPRSLCLSKSSTISDQTKPFNISPIETMYIYIKIRNQSQLVCVQLIGES